MNKPEQLIDKTADSSVPFIVTIDTEGDNIWSRPKDITTRNSSYLPRFQALCEKYGIRPTYLVNYEMATCPIFVEFGRDALRRDTAEIGMHLHAWNSPPIGKFGSGQPASLPYLIEFPADEMRDKIAYMTDLLETIFGTKMLSHRAGRWALNELYAGILVEKGYRVDCSVTPHVSWRGEKGFPDGDGGTDYRGFPEDAYFMDLADLKRRGDSPLLEVPMTIRKLDSALSSLVHRAASIGPSIARRTANRLFPRLSWFRPNGRNRSALLDELRHCRRRRGHLEFMLHSSEFMPGGSPTFRDARSIESLYEDLEAVFDRAVAGFKGMTLSEFYRDFSRKHGRPA